MTATIDINRLRRLAMDANGKHAAVQRASSDFRAANEDFRSAKRQLDDFLSTSGGVPETLSAVEERQSVGGTTGPNFGLIERRTMVSQYSLLKAVHDAAKTKAGELEAHHERLREEWNLASSLARRGVEYARTCGAVPSDIEELFQ